MVSPPLAHVAGSEDFAFLTLFFSIPLRSSSGHGRRDSLSQGGGGGGGKPAGRKNVVSERVGRPPSPVSRRKKVK